MIVPEPMDSMGFVHDKNMEARPATGSDLLREILARVLEDASRDSIFDSQCVSALGAIASDGHLTHVTRLKRILLGETGSDAP